MLVAYLFVMAVCADGPTRLHQLPLARLHALHAALSVTSTNGFHDLTLRAGRIWHWHDLLAPAERPLAYMTISDLLAAAVAAAATCAVPDCFVGCTCRVGFG